MARKPVLAFTMGDPSGIGPEILAAALSHPAVRRSCRPLAVGSREVLRRCGLRSLAPLVDPGVDCRARPGRPDPQGGRASFAAVRLAVRLAARGWVDGVVTGPVSKDSWRRAGIPYRDHTEYLEEVTGSRRVEMMLLAGGLRTVSVTRHLPLREVSGALRARDVVHAAESLHRALRERLGVVRPRLGLCALNPHAGESGMLGREESERLKPAVRLLRRRGIRIEGPIASDAAWSAHRRGLYDALVSLYHDQAMIPLKLEAPYGVVNWTLGIPFVRTSPGHGTAFDIAGRGKASPEALIEAALLAARLCSGN